MWGDYWMQSKFDSTMVGINFLTGSDPDTSDYMNSKSIPAKGGAGQNTWQYESPAVDKGLEQGATEFVPEERKKAYLTVQQTVRNDLPFLPMFQYATVRGHKSNIQGIEPNINVRIDTWNVGIWYLG
jgi:peptide/nickel transport system substrate-binding protein